MGSPKMVVKVDIETRINEASVGSGGKCADLSVSEPRPPPSGSRAARALGPGARAPPWRHPGRLALELVFVPDRLADSPSIVFFEVVAMPFSPSRAALLETCHCEAWAERVAAAGPYASLDELVAAARDAWWNEVRFVFASDARAVCDPEARAKGARGFQGLREGRGGLEAKACAARAARAAAREMAGRDTVVSCDGRWLIPLGLSPPPPRSSLPRPWAFPSFPFADAGVRMVGGVCGAPSDRGH